MTVTNGGTALTPVNESDPEMEPFINEPEETVSGQLYIMGTAVPNGTQRLEYCPDGSFKFHGTLFAGSLYIMNTDKQKGTTRYCKPSTTNADIVTRGTSYTSGYGVSSAEWNVVQTADSYRFTVYPNSLTLKGEQFTWWYEAWIVGGCTASGQRDGWSLEKGLAMTQNPRNPYEWTFVGQLKAYGGNEQANRFKINGQYDWNPKALHPYFADTNILTAKQAFSGTSQDNKWTIDRDGYYRITMNCFLETIDAEYLGETLPTGIVSTEHTEKAETAERIYDLSGRILSPHSPLHSPLKKGVYIKNGKKVLITN